MAELTHSIECLTAEQEVASSFPGARPKLKYLRNEGTSFVLQAARPSHGSDDHIKWRFHLQLET